MQIPEQLYRTAAVDFDRADAGSNTFPASLSSEVAYERGFGWEVLDHSPTAIDLSRAAEGLPLLAYHDTTRPIGLAKNVCIVDRRLRADLQFFSTDAGKEAAKMAKEGLRNISIGYQINDLEEIGKRNGVPEFRITRWTPLEASVVAIPADTTVGIGRSGTLTLKSKRNYGMEHPENNGVVSEADRVKAIVELGHSYGRYLRTNDVAEACRGSTPIEQFKDLVMARMQTGHTDTSSGIELGLNGREMRRYSLARAVQAQISGDWRDAGFEREVSFALAKATGRTAEGMFVPGEFFRRDFNVGTASEAGNLVPTDLRSDLYVDALRAALIMGQLGARILPGLSGNVDIPRKTTAASVAMLSEIGSASESAPVTAKLSLTPKRIGSFIEYSKQALMQAGMSLEGMLRDDLMQSGAGLLESQCFSGNGTSPNIFGLRSYTTIGTTTGGSNGATVAWSHFTDLEAACANLNATPGALAGYALNTKTKAKAKNVPRGTNLPFIIDPDVLPGPDGLVRLNGYRAAFSNHIPSNLTKGTSTTVCSAAIFSADWSMAVIALFGAPDIVVDPYTLAATGQVRITLNQFADFGIRQPGAFAKIDDLLTT